MKIIRTFHPIGQGAFYSERFYEGTECKHNVVYDCGVLKAESRHKKVVRQAFSKDDKIDYLFISHLDEDHISLVTTLWDSVRYIRHIVLPYISPKDVAVHRFLSRALGMMEVYGFWSMVSEAIEDGSFHDTLFWFVNPSYSNISQNRNNILSGESFSLLPDWIYIPYNKHMERKKELEDSLNDLVQNLDFQKVLRKVGVTIDTAEDLKNKITKAVFADLISSQAIRKYLKGAYKEITGTINQNSLLVYSGPSEEKSSYRLDMHTICPFIIHYYYKSGLCEWHLPYPIHPKQVACLYTGDSDLDMKGYEQELQKLWSNVGTIQLPHHGSYASFQYNKNKDKFNNRYVLPVSCGETNPYGHPSSKVFDFLMANDCFPVVVTEETSTKYSQVIVKTHV